MHGLVSAMKTARLTLPGKTRVLRVCGRTQSQMLMLIPPVIGALGIIVLSGIFDLTEARSDIQLMI